MPMLTAVTLMASPVQAAEACAQFRPDWDGGPVSMWSEAVSLLGSPVSLILLLATALVIRFKSSWGALVVCVSWSLLVSAFTFFDPTGGLRTAATAEGCIGPPTIFVAVAAALSVISILMTGTPKSDPPEP